MKYFALMILLSGATQLQAAIPVEQALELCRAEQNALRRLTCYDAISMQPQQQHTVSQAPVSSTATKAAAEEEFGKEHRNTIDESAPDLVYMTVKEISYDPYKSLIVEFDNGQIWQQLGTEYYRIKVGEQHYIKRALMNSFLLGRDDGRKAIRVRRKD